MWYTYIHVKAVGNKGVLCRKISSRTFCAAVQEDHLSSHLAKTRSPNAARSPLISLLCPRAAGIQIVSPSVSQLKVFGISASSWLLPERRSDLLEQLPKSVCGMLSWSPLTTSRSAPVPGTRFCSCTSGRLLRRPRCLGPCRT